MDAQERPTEGDQMLCMTGGALHMQKTVFETAAFQILIELPTNVVRYYPTLRCILHFEIGIVLFDKPIEKRLLRTVTPATNRSLAGILANQQLQQGREEDAGKTRRCYSA